MVSASLSRTHRVSAFGLALEVGIFVVCMCSVTKVMVPLFGLPPRSEGVAEM